MGAQHTPGPWDLVLENEHHGAYVAGPFGDICDLYAMSDPAALSVRNGATSRAVPFHNANANARLIAAAPDLLRELREARTTLSLTRSNIMVEMKRGRDYQWAGVPEILQARIDAMDAAIIRAAGATP
jgi:hypothetical protein